MGHFARMESRTQRGVNLADPDQYGLARHVYYSRFSGRVLALGLDPDDGFQECLLGIVTRNLGRAPWDPTRSGLYNYLVIVFTSVTRNLHAKQSALKVRMLVLGRSEDVAARER